MGDEGSGSSSRDPASGGTQEVTSPKAKRLVTAWRRYRARVHWPFIVVMAIATVGLATAGWVIQPVSSPQSPADTPSVGVKLTTTPRSDPQQLMFAVTPDAVAGLRVYPAELLIFVYSPKKGPIEAIAGKVSIDYAGSARFCGSFPDETIRRVKTSEGSLEFAVKSDTLSGMGVGLCWAHGGPIAMNGSYLSAAFPDSAWTPGFAISSAVNELRPPTIGGTSLEAFALQGGEAPFSVSGNGWDWHSAVQPASQADLGSGRSTFSQEVFATNVVGLQRDDRHAFYAGILLGVAGGALVALLGELTMPLTASRRRSSGPV